MNYIYIERMSVCNGLGIRLVLWVAGCEHKCLGCHNKELWNPSIGKPFTGETYQQLSRFLSLPYVTGVTFSGGDPLAFYNRQDILKLAKRLKQDFPNKDIWCYTGYIWEDIKDLEGIENFDIVVDGEFLVEQRDITLPFRGSANQRIIDVEASLKMGYAVERSING